MIEVSVGQDGQIQEGNGHQSQGAAVARPIYQECGVTHEFTVGGVNGGPKAGTVNTVTGADLQIDTGGVLDTARNSGMPVTHASAVKDSSVVKVGGVEMTALSAAKAGLLTRNPDGSYAESDGQKKASVDETEVATKVEFAAELSTPEIESAFEGMATQLGGYDALDRQALSVISGLSTGDLSGKGLASALGVEPDAASAFIEGVYDRYRGQAAAHIARTHGVDGNAAIEWAGANLSASELSSIMIEVYQGRRGGLDSLSAKYIKAMSIADSRARGKK